MLPSIVEEISSGNIAKFCFLYQTVRPLQIEFSPNETFGMIVDLVPTLLSNFVTSAFTKLYNNKIKSKISKLEKDSN
jgi:hypothetical protein